MLQNILNLVPFESDPIDSHLDIVAATPKCIIAQFIDRLSDYEPS